MTWKPISELLTQVRKFGPLRTSNKISPLSVQSLILFTFCGYLLFKVVEEL